MYPKTTVWRTRTMKVTFVRIDFSIPQNCDFSYAGPKHVLFPKYMNPIHFLSMRAEA
jgi:hypothetical protein